MNARYGSEKVPTSPFYLNLEPGPNNKAAKYIKYIYKENVTNENPKIKQNFVQQYWQMPKK